MEQDRDPHGQASGAASNWLGDTGASAVPSMKQDPDPHGQAGLMLCECLLILLVEQGHLPKERVLDAIGIVIDVKQEIAGRTEGVAVSMASIGLLRAVAQSLSATTVMQPDS